MRWFWGAYPLAAALLVLTAGPASAAQSTGAAAEASLGRYEAAGESIVDAHAYLQLGRIHAERNEWQEAVVAYEKLIELGPIDREVRMEYADALREAGQLERAIEQYEYVLNGVPVDDLLAEAEQAYASGDFATALQLYEQITAEYPANTTAWLSIARIHFARSNWTSAITAYERLVQLGPVERDVRMEYGDALRESGDLERAIEQYNYVVQDGGGAAPASSPPATEFKLPPPPSGLALGDSGGNDAQAPPTAAPALQPPSEPSEPELVQPVLPAPSIPVETSAPRADQAYIAREVSTQPVYFSQNAGGAADTAEADTQAEDSGDASATDWLQQARLHAERKQWAEAVVAYENLIAQRPIELAIRLEYADALREAGELSKAEDEYNTVLFADTENVDAKIGLALTLALRGDLEESMYLLDQIYLDAESFTRARLARAYAYFVNDYVQEAWRDIGDTLARFPENMDAIALLQEKGFTEEAWLEARQMLALNPENAEAIALIDQIIESEKLRLIGLTTAEAGSAEWLFQAGNYEEAKREFERMVRDDPRNATAWLRLATMYRWDEQWELALEAYAEYLELMPEDYEARLRYAQVLLWSGCPAAACDELWALINDANTPLETYEEALMSYAVALTACELYDEALCWFEEALMFRPHNPEVFTAYGGLLAQLERYKEAVVQYCAALDEDPSYEEAIMGLARTYAWMGDQERARYYYDRILMSSRYYPQSRIGKAYTYLWAGDREMAYRLADEAAWFAPGDQYLIQLYEDLERVPGPTMVTALRESTDNDGNDSTGLVVRLIIPLTADGASLSVEHEGFKVIHRFPPPAGTTPATPNDESEGTRTRADLALPVGDDVTLRTFAEYVDVDNTYTDVTPQGALPTPVQSPHHDNLNYGASVDVDLGEDFTATVGYQDRMLFYTPRMAQTGVTVQETIAGGTYTFGDDDTHISVFYTAGDYSDGNQRDEWNSKLWHEYEFRGRGNLNAGIRTQNLSYAQDLDNGYWDPSSYEMGELFVDWIDMSNRPLKLDGSFGIGLQDVANAKTQDLFRWGAGLRYQEPGSPLDLRTGYYYSDAANFAGTQATGYRYKSWYFSAAYNF